MEKNIRPINWHNDLKNRFNGVSLDEDFILVEQNMLSPVFQYPFKMDMTVTLISTRGSMRGRVNLQSREVKAPFLLTTLPNQILQYEYVSDDYEGCSIVMSRQMADSLLPHLQKHLSLVLTTNDNPVIQLKEEEVSIFLSLYQKMKEVVGMTEHPYRADVIRHLVLTFFYLANGLRSFEGVQNTPKGSLVRRFMDLVKEHYKGQRGVQFYADKLCLTPKYLSQVIKNSTGKSANEWIDEHVMLEGKALLYSTNLTIQQISDELGFPSQSFFGKYFKRHEGVAPREYRER